MHPRLAPFALLLSVLAGAGGGTLLGPTTAAFAQAPTYVAGTGVGLVPPKGMTPAKGFSGFEDAATGASILVAELPAEAYAEVAKTFTAEGLASTGVQASGPAVDWKIQGGQGGRLVRGKQTARGTVFRKWVLLAKGPSSTAMISVQVPDAKNAGYSDGAIEAALKTVALRMPPGLDEKAAALPFRVGDRAGFRLVRVLAGSGLLLTDGPKDVVTDASQPVVIVASALGSTGAQDKAAMEALAQQAFASIAGIDDVTIVSQTIEEKDGVARSRIEGRGTYRSSMEAVSTLQHVRFDKGSYVRVVAIARSLDKDKLLPRVDALAASIAPK